MSNSSSPDLQTPPVPGHKRSRWKAFFQNMALAGGVFLLCIVLLEVVLRICGFGHLEIYEPDAKLYWKLKPNQDCFTKIDHKPVHINSLGTRGREFAVQKPPNTIRILSLGDSRTFGWGLAEAETYSARLEQALQQQVGAGKKVEVINAGVNAWSFAQMLVYFRDIGARYQPDIVVVGEANLWTQFSEQNSPEFVRQFLWRVRLKNFLRHFAIFHFVVEVQLHDFYTQTRMKFIPIDPKTDALFKSEQQADPLAFFRVAIEDICRVAQANGVKPLLLFLPQEASYKIPHADWTLQMKQDIHRQLGVPLVDLSADLSAEGKLLYLDADPVHLNARGNEIVARRLLDAVQALLSHE